MYYHKSQFHYAECQIIQMDFQQECLAIKILYIIPQRELQNDEQNRQPQNISIAHTDCGSLSSTVAKSISLRSSRHLNDITNYHTEKRGETQMIGIYITEISYREDER